MDKKESPEISKHPSQVSILAESIAYDHIDY
jgi:hypothetical protein